MESDPLIRIDTHFFCLASLAYLSRQWSVQKTPVYFDASRPAEEPTQDTNFSGGKPTFQFTLKGEKLAFYEETTHQFTVKPGTFDLRVGNSSADIRSSGTILVIH